MLLAKKNPATKNFSTKKFSKKTKIEKVENFGKYKIFEKKKSTNFFSSSEKNPEKYVLKMFLSSDFLGRKIFRRRIFSVKQKYSELENIILSIVFFSVSNSWQRVQLHTAPALTPRGRLVRRLL